MICNPSPTLALYLMSKPFDENPSNSLSSTIVVPDLNHLLTNIVVLSLLIVFQSGPSINLINESSNQMLNSLVWSLKEIYELSNHLLNVMRRCSASNQMLVSLPNSFEALYVIILTTSSGINGKGHKGNGLYLSILR